MAVRQDYVLLVMLVDRSTGRRYEGVAEWTEDEGGCGCLRLPELAGPPEWRGRVPVGGPLRFLLAHLIRTPPDGDRATEPAPRAGRAGRDPAKLDGKRRNALRDRLARKRLRPPEASAAD